MDKDYVILTYSVVDELLILVFQQVSGVAKSL